MTDIQTLYQDAIKFAAEKHGTQKVKGSKNSYVVHLSNVAMELRARQQLMAARWVMTWPLSSALPRA